MKFLTTVSISLLNACWTLILSNSKDRIKDSEDMRGPIKARPYRWFSLARYPSAIWGVMEFIYQKKFINHLKPKG